MPSWKTNKKKMKRKKTPQIFWDVSVAPVSTFENDFRAYTATGGVAGGRGSRSRRERFGICHEGEGVAVVKRNLS